MSTVKDLPHRNWPELVDLWINDLPTVGYDIHPTPSIKELGVLASLKLDDRSIVEYPRGLREAIFREAIVLTRKAAYCLSLLVPLSAAGRPTWTLVAAYDAAFYGAKAICYLLGIVPVGRDSKLYLDPFHQTITGPKKRRVVSYDSVFVFRLRDRMTHEILWEVFSRLLRTSRFEDVAGEAVGELLKIDWERFSASRNKLFYDSPHWTFLDQWTDSDLCKFVSNLAVNNYLVTGNLVDEVPYSAEYYHGSAQIRKLLRQMIQDIGRLAPALLVEAEALADGGRSASTAVSAVPHST